MSNRLKDSAREAVYWAKMRFAHSSISNYSYDYQPFIIVTRGRSGSTLLVERLRSHPAIICPSEIFGDSEIEITGSRRDKLQKDRRPGMAPVPFLERYLWRPQPRNIQAVGAKFLYSDVLERLNDSAFIARLQSVKILHLRRKNYLKSYLSSVRVLETGVFAHRRQDQVANRALYVDPVLCEKFFELLARTEKHLSTVFSGSSVLTLYYEDLVRDLPEGDTQICDFLGVSQQMLAHSVKKMSSGALRDQIENWDEVRQHFEHGKWASFLE